MRRHIHVLVCALSLIAVGATHAQTPAPAATAPVAATPAAVNSPGATTPAPSTPSTTTTTTTSAGKGVVGNHNARLSDRIPPEQQLQLQAGDDSFAARYIANLSPDERGVVIVLHDSGQHQSWPFTVAALLDELPLHGWGTLALALPAAVASVATASTPATATPAAAPATPAPAAANPASAPTLLTGSESGIEKQAQARIDAALAKLTELNGGQPQPTVVIGFGSGAWRSVEFARRLAEGNGARLPEPLRALVLIDPANQPPGTQVDLPKLLPLTTLPTFDVVQDERAQTRADAEARRRAVLHQRERIYQRLALPPLNAVRASEHTVLTKRIRSWVQRYVPMEEKKEAAKAAPVP